MLLIADALPPAVLTSQGLVRSRYPFAHDGRHDLPSGITLVSSYHCSRYNTNTRVLTPEMFDAVFASVRAALDD